MVRFFILVDNYVFTTYFWKDIHLLQCQVDIPDGSHHLRGRIDCLRSGRQLHHADCR